MPRLAPRRLATTIVSAVLALALTVLLVLICLQPQHPEAGVSEQMWQFLNWAHDSTSFRWITFRVLERGANVLLFVPVGVIAFLLIPRSFWPASLIVGPVVSVAIEIAQWALLPIRTASPVDILMNTFGSTIGVALAALISLPLAVYKGRPEARTVVTPRLIDA